MLAKVRLGLIGIAMLFGIMLLAVLGVVISQPAATPFILQDKLPAID